MKACSHEPGVTGYPGQVRDAEVDFATVHCLKPVPVYMSILLTWFRCPRATSVGGSLAIQHWVTCFVRVAFLSVNRMQKLLSSKSSFVRDHYQVQKISPQ